MALQDYTPRDIAIEVLGWSVLYFVVVVNHLVPFVRGRLSSKPFWDAMAKRQGQVLTSMAEEGVLSISISAHHLFGGALMLYGQVYDSPRMWVHGLLVEIGFEVVDMLALMANVWPYTIVQPKLKTLTIFHHLPGLVVGPIMVLNDFHRDANLQRIGWSLLLAGGVSLLCDGFKQTRDLDSQMGTWLSLHVFNMTGVLLARFMIFPVASYKLIATCAAGSPWWITALCVFGCTSMAVFNLVIIGVMSEKLVRNGSTYLKKQFGPLAEAHVKVA